MNDDHSVEKDSSKLASKKRRANGPLVREEKQRKWLAKQLLIKQREENQLYRQKWIRQHSNICHTVSLRDVQYVKNTLDTELPRWGGYLRSYFDLKNANVQKDHFVAEGVETVRVLMKQLKERRCPIEICSVLVKPGAYFGEQNSSSGLLSDWLECEESQRPKILIVEDDKVFDEITGFPVGRGAMACGIPRRITWKDVWPTSIEASSTYAYLLDPSRSCKRFIALDGVSNLANMGSIIRCAAAFGIDAIFLTDDCCNVWHRQSVRVSMGYIAKVPIIEVKKKMLAKVLSTLIDSGITCYASTSEKGDKQLCLEELQKNDIPSNWCCVLGNEANGIQEEVVKSCSYSIRINMVDGVDSLSISIATGILLHGFVEKSKG